MILNIKASRILTKLFLVSHLGAVVLVMVLPVAWPVRVTLWGLLGWSLHRSLTLHAWRTSPLTIEAIELDDQGMAAVRYKAGADWHPVRVTSSFVHPWLTLATLRLESRRWPVNLVIAADAVGPEPFRRWRVALKLQMVEG